MASTTVGDFFTSLDVVVRIHQHFGLDDRHDVGFLTQRGIARQRMRIDMDRVVGRRIVANRDDGAPLGETRTGRLVFFQALAQTIQTFGDGFLCESAGERLGALIDLDPRNHAL